MNSEPATPAWPAEPEAAPDLYCALPPQPARVMPADLSPERLEAIVAGELKWANGTVLHYYFFDRDTDGSTVAFDDGTSRFVSWVGSEQDREVVRSCFQEWQDLGIGLRFREVTDRAEAEIRIGFMRGDGHWSRLGRSALNVGVNERTMNFGQPLTGPGGRRPPLHEIGHVLGMPHEHQYTNAGIVWNEEAVFEFFAQPPNSWSRPKTFQNILARISPEIVTGSPWDPTSIMEYGFPGGLIIAPPQFAAGLPTPLVISPVDKEYVLRWYPPTGPVPPPALPPFESRRLGLKAGGQADFTLVPDGTREYAIGTFGDSDVVMVLFEEVDGELRFVAGDDDSAQPRNARLTARLFTGRSYVLRIRLYSSWTSGEVAVMYW
jgi:hypothetical protein